jgi:hypothetical protein
MNQKSLYERLGGYDGIAAFANDLLPRLKQILNWVVSGNIGETMVLREKSNCWLIICVRVLAVPYTTPAEK